MIILILAIPLMENVIMKQHAWEYSYDRMKGIWLLSFLCCELVKQLIEGAKEKKRIYIFLMSIVTLSCIMNLRLYKNSEDYIWDANYRSDNVILAQYINEQYPDSVLAIKEVSVRGYANVLFARGIYEWYDESGICWKASQKGVRYAIIFNIEDAEAWNMYDFGGATVYDLVNGKVHTIDIDKGIILEK